MQKQRYGDLADFALGMAMASPVALIEGMPPLMLLCLFFLISAAFISGIVDRIHDQKMELLEAEDRVLFAFRDESEREREPWDGISYYPYALGPKGERLYNWDGEPAQA